MKTSGVIGFRQNKNDLVFTSMEIVLYAPVWPVVMFFQVISELGLVKVFHSLVPWRRLR